MDLIFNQDDRFFAHDGVDPAPGDDDPIEKIPNVEEILEEDADEDDDDFGDDEEDDDDEDDGA